MHTHPLLAVPLSALFATLLSGCPLFGCDTIESEQTLDLTPEEYAQWQMGMMPGASTGAPTTSAGPTTSETTGTDTTTDTGTTTGTTGDSTSSGGSTTGTPLTPEEVCTAVCTQYYGGTLISCSLAEQADKVVVTCNTLQACIGGRGHACVRPQGAAAGPDPGAAWLARCAHDEAASVHAFQALARELASLGAPAELRTRIEDASRDERRHAVVVSALARSRGAEPTPPTYIDLPARDLPTIAVENMIEGCVRETWAALCAAHQARHAADPAVRALFTEIAEDEARHAELAWAIDAWLATQLDAAARATLAAARHRAARELLGSLAARADAPELRELGVPTARTASHLCAALGRALWSQAA